MNIHSRENVFFYYIGSVHESAYIGSLAWCGKNVEDSPKHIMEALDPLECRNIGDERSTGF